MAKQIFIADRDVEKILKEIKQQISRTKNFNSIDIKKELASDKRKVVIDFTPDAWNKLTALVREFSTEVQWHGLVRRLGACEFEIYDILVPPHSVTGSTVTSDPAKYSEWINSLDDETFNALHFHGHSHVNMACHPSSTDTKYRHDLVTQLSVPRDDSGDSFYIFLIFNKRGEWTGEVYDLKQNALYGTGDIDIRVYTEDGFLSDFIKAAKEVVVEEKPQIIGSPASAYPYYQKYLDKRCASKDTKYESAPVSQRKGDYDWYDEEDDPTSPFYLGGGW